MPAYINSPFAPPPVLLQKGVAAYLWGTYNYHQAPTRMLVNNVALTSNVATITVQITEGEIPAVGALISVLQTQSTSGLFNVKRVAVTGATITGNGAGTITFALTHADVATAADTGSAIVEVPEVPETLANGASIPCCIQAPEGDSQFTVPFAVTFPTLPTTATVSIQAALHDIDSEYTTLVTAGAVATSVQTVGPFGYVTLQRGYFYRFLVASLAGSGTIVAKIGG